MVQCFIVCKDIDQNINILIMGAANIIEKHIKQTTNSLWQKLPQLPNSPLNNVQLDKYNKSFVNFVILIGAITLIKSSVTIGKKAIKFAIEPKKPPSKEQLLQKYGYASWALIADCANNEQYCKFLAKNGFNLILMGKEENISNISRQVQLLNKAIKVEEIIVDWKKEEINLHFYQELNKKLEHHDISFLILPKIPILNSTVPTYSESIQPFQHIYLLVRYFAPKLKWRSYRSAIIFPSYPVIDDISINGGVTKSLISGSDAFGRIIGYQLRETVEVIVARGSVEKAFTKLGVQRISY